MLSKLLQEQHRRLVKEIESPQQKYVDPDLVTALAVIEILNILDSRLK